MNILKLDIRSLYKTLFLFPEIYAKPNVSGLLYNCDISCKNSFNTIHKITLCISC